MVAQNRRSPFRGEIYASSGDWSPSPRNNAIAPFNRFISSGDSRPINGPNLLRRTDVILSTAIQDTVRNVSVPNRSDWTITRGRGLPVKSPPCQRLQRHRRGSLTGSSPRAVVIEDADVFDPGHQFIRLISFVDMFALTPHLGREPWHKRVGNLYLNWPQTATAEGITVAPGPKARCGHARHASYVTITHPVSR